DVARKSKVEQPALLVEHARANLDGEHRPVLAAVKGFKNDGLAGGGARGPAGHRLLPAASVQKAGMHADQLLPGVAETLARLAVDVDDAQLLVMDEKRIRRTVDERAKTRFACAQAVLRLPQIGNVLQDAELSNGTAGLIARDVALA